MGAPHPLAPLVLGRYALYDKIASGGMATVHLGRLLGSVGFSRTVAIKRMRPELACDPQFVAMFLDEARLVARFSHPNVVPTLDVVAIDGELFIVMEYVRGESLLQLLRAAIGQGSLLPPPMVAAILVGVLHGLHAAHEAKSERGEALGIVHRDVSPQNILVGVDGVPRVLDFGVAKAVDRLQTTREGELKGKLAYMAPEQISGGEVSRVTDVYAASVVLWEALTARRLFVAEGEGQVLRQVLEGCREPPSAHVPGLPDALDIVTMRGLSIDPAARYATAREMAIALENAVPLMTASNIGAWVEGAARETLDLRNERIAAIESDSRSEASVLPAVFTPVARSFASTPTKPSPGERNRRPVWWLLLPMVIAAAGMIVYLRRGKGAAALPIPSAQTSRSDVPGPPSPEPAPVNAASTTEARQRDAPMSTLRDGFADPEDGSLRAPGVALSTVRGHRVRLFTRLESNGSNVVDRVLRGAVDWASRDYRRCYEHAFIAAGDLPSGTVTVSFDIIDQLPKHLVVEASTVSSSVMDRCVAKALEGRTFNAAGVEATGHIVYAFRFLVLD